MTLRNQDLSFGQLEVLKMEDIGITLEAIPREGETVIETDFVDVIVSVTNNLGEYPHTYIFLFLPLIISLCPRRRQRIENAD
jgi:hypothetical protein